MVDLSVMSNNIPFITGLSCSSAEAYIVPLGKGIVRKFGTDVTIVATSHLVHEALFAADEKNFHKQQLIRLSEKYNLSTGEIENLIHLWLFEKPLRLIKIFQRK